MSKFIEQVAATLPTLPMTDSSKLKTGEIMKVLKMGDEWIKPERQFYVLRAHGLIVCLNNPASTFPISSDLLKGYVLPAGSTVTITVSDNGC